MLYLPSNTEHLSAAICKLLQDGEAVRRTRSPEWIINRALLDGVRKFDNVNYDSGLVTYSYRNTEGKLTFRNEQALRHLQIEMGRFLGIDVRPSCKMKGYGLDRLRKANVGQALLDSEFPARTIQRIRVPFHEDLLTCGFAALGASVVDAGLFSSATVLENISPWEILPAPASQRSPNRCEVIMRARMLPKIQLMGHEEIKDKLNDADCQFREVPWGELEEYADSAESGISGRVLGFLASRFSQAFGSALQDEPNRKMSKTKDGRVVGRVTEAFVQTPDGIVRRYIVMVGKKIVLDVDYEKEGTEVYMPIGVARYYPVGFYGRSFVGPILSWTLEAEEAARAIFQMVRDWDSLGLLTLPTGIGISDRSFRIAGRPRKVWYSPDPADPSGNSRPDQIQPHSPGTLPQQGFAVADSGVSKMAGQSDLFSGDAPGRADSQASLGFLLETSNVGIEAPGNSVAEAWTTVYAAGLSAAKKRLVGQKAMFEVLSLDDMSVGVILNDQGGLDLQKNPIPGPDEVDLNIKSRTPPSPTQLAGELKEQLQLGVIDHEEYRLEVYRKGLDLPVGHQDEYNAWRNVRLQIRTLFNDGVTPGRQKVMGDDGQMAEKQVWTSDPELIDATIFLREVSSFMKSPEFGIASPAVRDEFILWKRAIAEGQTGGLPPGAPGPEEIGMEQRMPEEEMV